MKTAETKNRTLYFYDLTRCEENPNWEDDKEAMWEMTVEEFQEAFNSGDYSYENNCIYFFFSHDVRMTHLARHLM